MPKINVYLPDDLAEAVRDTGVPVSPICQRALEQAVRRIGAIRQALLDDLTDADLAARLPSLTARTITVLGLARDAGGPVTTGALLGSMIAEGSNLALQVLRSMEIEPATLTVPTGAEPSGGPSFSTPAAVALELAVAEATGLGHNYVGCEHLLIGLAAEPDGTAGEVLRTAGADPRAVRRAVSAALAGYAHLRAQQALPAQSWLKAELAPLIQRIEALEARAQPRR